MLPGPALRILGAVQEPSHTPHAPPAPQEVVMSVSEAPQPAVLGEFRYRRPGGRIGDIVVDLGFCSRDLVEECVEQAIAAGEQLGRVLVMRRAITPDQLAVAIAHRFGLDHKTLSEIDVDFNAAALLPGAEARRLGVVPYALSDGGQVLMVAIANPDNFPALDDVSMFTNRRLRPVVVSEIDLDVLLRRISVLDEEGIVEEEEDEEIIVRESADDAPTIRLVRSIIAQAVDRGASDIHFDPLDDGTLVVRYRIDGVMSEAARVPRSQSGAIISRIKIMGDLDISERRLPQDGRIGFDLEHRHVDIRVAVMPLVKGESAVLRILDSSHAALTLDELGMSPRDLGRLEGPLGLSHGGILATGPTGAGKTTTLYAIIDLVRTPEKTLMTIEDPVEYRLDGVNQIQVSERVGLSYGTGLRAILRADPDVIMVGEMRDRESAHMAIDAALTGHLVLSTLHTNDAPSAPLRLIDMGMEPYLVAAAINCVIAQRLARKLCESCRRPMAVPGEHVDQPGIASVEIFEATGCPRCRGTGYDGRIGIYEIMGITDEIRHLIVTRAPAHEVRQVAVAQGMTLLRSDGMAKVRSGRTTLAEIGRVLG
jgi:type IV pilus assembly protein PilB